MVDNEPFIDHLLCGKPELEKITVASGAGGTVVIPIRPPNTRREWIVLAIGVQNNDAASRNANLTSYDGTDTMTLKASTAVGASGNQAHNPDDHGVMPLKIDYDCYLRVTFYSVAASKNMDAFALIIEVPES